MKVKILQTDEETHKKIKMNALKSGLTIREYIVKLVEQDNGK